MYYVIWKRKRQRTRENARKYFKCIAEKLIERMLSKTEDVFQNTNKTTSNMSRAYLSEALENAVPAKHWGRCRDTEKKEASGFPDLTLSTEE